MSTLDIQRQITENFIAFDPVTIALVPRKDVSDGAGGFIKTEDSPRKPQTFALIEPGNSGFEQPVHDDAGKSYILQFMLLGTYDADMDADDVFTYNGTKYKLLAIMPDNRYEKRAVVVSNGW